MEYAVEELGSLAEVFTGVSNGSRLAILVGLARGWSMPEVAEFLGVQRGGLQRHIDILVRSELVYRPPDDRVYALTALGEFVVELVDEASNNVLETLVELEEIREELEDDVPDWVDDRERKIHTESWERVLHQQ